MSKMAHQLLDQLMNEVKQNLFTDQIAKMKAEILADVDKKNSDIVQDFVQIADTIHKEIVEDVVKRNKFGETRVHRECKKGDVAMLRLCLQSPGVDVNAR